MANSARARSTCAAGALSERLKRVSSWRSSAVSGRRGSFRWRDMGHLGTRGSPHHYTRAHGRRPTSDEIIVSGLSLKLEHPLLGSNTQVAPVTGKGQIAEIVKLFRMMGKQVFVLADLAALT